MKTNRTNLQSIMRDRELTGTEKIMITNHFIKDRLTNYGYDWRAFKNMSNQASKLRGKIRAAYANGLLNRSYGIYGRVIVELDENGEIIAVKEYITGQSYNEELITLYECFLDRD